MENKENNITTNKKAFYEYDILKKYEAGIVLKGSEVKSLRKKQWSFKKIISGFGTSPKTKI